jgi:hypothetical protein
MAFTPVDAAYQIGSRPSAASSAHYRIRGWPGLGEHLGDLRAVNLWGDVQQDRQQPQTARHRPGGFAHVLGRASDVFTVVGRGAGPPAPGSGRPEQGHRKLGVTCLMSCPRAADQFPQPRRVRPATRVDRFLDDQDPALLQRPKMIDDDPVQQILDDFPPAQLAGPPTTDPNTRRRRSPPPAPKPGSGNR